MNTKLNAQDSIVTCDLNVTRYLQELLISNKH